MDLLSELKELVQRKDEISASFCAGFVYHESIERLLAKYGWHSVSEPPTETACYFVTIEDKTGNYVAMAHWDPRHYRGDGWQVHGVIRWVPIPEPYKPDAAK